jgi:hypothetical protein
MDGRKLLRLPYWLWTKFGEGQLPSAKLTSVHGAANICCPPDLPVDAFDATGPNLPFVTSTADDGPQPELDIRYR